MNRKNRNGQRAPYISQACSVCRHKKTKCTGERPICHTCQTSGFGNDCSWASEPVKRIYSREYVESLLKRIEELVKYTAVLENKVEQCRTEHGGVVEEDFLRMRPSMMVEDSDGFSDNEEELADKMRAFHIVGEDLQLYGKTSIFQYAPSVPGNRSRFPEIVEDASRCYVLMVDGADESKYNPNFDWARHLPVEVYLDRREHDKILDLLFKFCSSWCLKIVPPLFLRDMYRALRLPASQIPCKTAHYSPMLHNALLAFATAFSDNTRLRDIRSRQCFLQRAKSYIDTECHSPNISVIHALAMIGYFHSSMGDQTLGYLYFGMSGRLSQALGLGIDCTPWVNEKFITHDDMLDRNWAHWTTFSQDVCWSLYVGREFCVAPPSDIPIPFVDPEFDQIPWHHPASGIPPQPGYLSSTFVATCSLLQIGRQIMDVVNALSNPTRQEAIGEMVSKLDVELNAWKETLPQDVAVNASNRNTATPHRLMLEMAFWWLFILLHRPFYRRVSSPEIDHVKQCDRAARKIMELLDVWRSRYTLRFTPITIFVQVVFSAGTVFILSAVRAVSGMRTANVSFSNSLAQADLCFKYLDEAGKSFESANHIAGILQNLLREEFKSKLADKGVPSGLIAAPGSSTNVHSLGSNPQHVGYGMELSQTPDMQPPNSHYYVWDSNNPVQGSAAFSGSNQWSGTERAAPHIGAPMRSSTLMGMGLGMRGGETLSNRPYSPNQFRGGQLEYQPVVFDDRDPQEPLDLNEEDTARLLQTLNNPYTANMDPLWSN